VPVLPGYRGEGARTLKNADRFACQIVRLSLADQEAHCAWWAGGKGDSLVRQGRLALADELESARAAKPSRLWRWARRHAGETSRNKPRISAVQVFGDSHGNTVPTPVFRTRLPRLQRRPGLKCYGKEAPAPAMPGRIVRKAMTERARRETSPPPSNTGAGDGRLIRRWLADRLSIDSFWFLEMKQGGCRVEHPLPIMVTGTDLGSNGSFMSRVA